MNKIQQKINPSFDRNWHSVFFLESSIVPHTAFNPTDCLPNGLTGPGDPYSDFGQSSNSDLSNFRSSNHSGDHQFNQSAFGMNDDSMVHQLIPTPHNTIDENDEYFTVSGPIFLTVSSNLTNNIIFYPVRKNAWVVQPTNHTELGDFDRNWYLDVNFWSKKRRELFL